MTRRILSSALAALTFLSGILAVPAGAQTVLGVELTEYSLSPNQIEVALGDQIEVRLFNNGSLNHTFVIETYANYDTNITPGSQASAFFTAEAVGTYPMYCVLPGHRDLGMEGTFTVRRLVTTPPVRIVEVVGLLAATALAAVAVVVLLRSRRDSET